MNLIPTLYSRTCNYWCSWDTQWNMMKESLPTGADVPTRDQMNEMYLYGEDGVLKKYFRPIRRDLFVVLDDGWDVPYGTTDSRYFGTLVADERRFPGIAGTPQQRLEQMNKRIQNLGYRGMGLWVPVQVPWGPGQEHVLDMKKAREHWSERAKWCHEAGVAYWKVDWGAVCHNPDYREMMTDCVRQYAPNLIIEHALCQGGFDPKERTPEEKAARENYLSCILPISDTVRTYDVSPEFKYTTTFNRTAEMLRLARATGKACAIISVEDTDIIGAALGCSLGVMRHEKEMQWKKMTYDPRPITESVRAIRWQRMAPPFASHRVPVAISEEIIEDVWYYPVRDKKLWPCTCDETVHQWAPAAISRNMELPIVEAEGKKPMVACSIHPDTGALSVAAIPRTLLDKLYYTPKATITLRGARAYAPIGIFGHYGQLNIHFDEELAGKRIYAQDLCSDAAKEITDKVEIRGKELRMCGQLIEDLADGAPAQERNALPGIVVCIMD